MLVNHLTKPNEPLLPILKCNIAKIVVFQYGKNFLQEKFSANSMRGNFKMFQMTHGMKADMKADA